MTRRNVPLPSVIVVAFACIGVIAIFWNADAIRHWFWRVVG